MGATLSLRHHGGGNGPGVFIAIVIIALGVLWKGGFFASLAPEKPVPPAAVMQGEWVPVLSTGGATSFAASRKTEGGEAVEQVMYKMMNLRGFNVVSSDHSDLSVSPDSWEVSFFSSKLMQTTRSANLVFDQPGAVWQWQWKYEGPRGKKDESDEDKDGKVTMNTLDFVMTGGYGTPPCCLPGYFKNIKDARGPCQNGIKLCPDQQA